MNRHESSITCGHCKGVFTGWNYDGTLWMYTEHLRIEHPEIKITNTTEDGE